MQQRCIQQAVILGRETSPPSQASKRWPARVFGGGGSIFIKLLAVSVVRIRSEIPKSSATRIVAEWLATAFKDREIRSSGFTGCGCPPETNALTMPMTAQKRGSLW